MKFPWKKAIDAARAGARILHRQRTEKPRLRKCPIDDTDFGIDRPDLQICARGHRFGPNEPRGTIPEYDNRGEI